MAILQPKFPQSRYLPRRGSLGVEYRSRADGRVRDSTPASPDQCASCNPHLRTCFLRHLQVYPAMSLYRTAVRLQTTSVPRLNSSSPSLLSTAIAKPRYLTTTPHRLSSDPPSTPTSSSPPAQQPHPPQHLQQQQPSQRSSQTQRPAPPPRAPGHPGQPQYAPFKVWPFVLIFLSGTVLFSQLVQQRKGTSVTETDTRKFH